MLVGREEAVQRERRAGAPLAAQWGGEQRPPPHPRAHAAEQQQQAAQPVRRLRRRRQQGPPTAPLRYLFIQYPTYSAKQGSGSVLDPDLIRSVDPDPYSESGSRRAKITYKREKEISCFLSAGCSLLGAENFFCNVDVLYGGLDIGKL